MACLDHVELSVLLTRDERPGNYFLSNTSHCCFCGFPFSLNIELLTYKLKLL